MESQRVDASGWISTLFDVDHVNMYVITIPSLLMVMLGARKFALLYFFGACMFLLLKKMG